MGRIFERAYGVLQADKRLMDDDCKALMVRDFERKFAEYFELPSGTFVSMEKLGGKYRISITFEAERIKQFQVLK